jgi:hypothetical protein
MRSELSKYFFLLFFLLLMVPDLSAQNETTDTIQKPTFRKDNRSDVLITGDHNISGKTDSTILKKHSPKKAAWMSAALPGLGQIYNHKYWKLPIIYVGFGVIGYLGYYFNNNANKFKSSYLVRSKINESKTDYYPEITSPDVLYRNFTSNRRNFELTCIFGSLFYVLNIIDASVDAHLYKFDISEDLSLRIEPDIIKYNYTTYNNPSTGIKISLHF